MIQNPGRKVVFWAGVFIGALFSYVLFDRLYTHSLAWLLFQGIGRTSGFWDTQLDLIPIVVGAYLAVVAAALMIVWNFRARRKPATDVTYLFWIGLMIMAFFGPSLVVGLKYIGGSYLRSYPFDLWLFVVGLQMVVTALGTTITRLNRRPTPAMI